MGLNKISFTSNIILSIIFATVLTLDSLIVFPGTVHATINTVYFKPFEISNFVIYVVSLIGTFLFINLLEFFSNRLARCIYSKEDKAKSIKVYFIILAILLLCWLPTLLSYFPGGLFSDTVSSLIEYYINNTINNYNPVIYTFVLIKFIDFGQSLGSMQIGIGLFTIFQYLIMAAILAYVIYWLYKQNISLLYLVLTTAYFGLMRLIPMYMISIWKDTPFSLALLLLTLFLANTVCEEGKNLNKPLDLLKFSLIILAVSFLRKNGFYVAIVIILLLILVYRKLLSSIVSVVLIIAIFFIQGPVFSFYDLNNKLDSIEGLGIPFQQMYYVVSKDGNISEEQLKFLSNILPIEKIKENYNPLLFDTIKMEPGFNSQFVEDHKSEIIKVWLEIFKQNPLAYIKSYLLNTLGYWDINIATFDQYINPQMWENSDSIQAGSLYFYQNDYIQILTGKSLRSIIRPSKPISTALFLYISLFSAVITIYRKKYKNLLIYLPGLLTWGTVMLAAPLFNSLRYVFILVLMVPLNLLIPFFKTDPK